MAYYKVRIEVWCDWGILRRATQRKLSGMLRLARALFALCGKSSRSWIVRKISRMRKR